MKMRLFVSLTLMFLAVGAALVLLLSQPDGDAGAGRYGIVVMGPDGVIYEGNVSATATAYHVLMAAAADGGFEVGVTGSGPTLFVTHIDGHRNQGGGGWCFAIDDGTGPVYPQVGAGQAQLEPGDRVLWMYHDAGCPGA